MAKIKLIDLAGGNTDVDFGNTVEDCKKAIKKHFRLDEDDNDYYTFRGLLNNLLQKEYASLLEFHFYLHNMIDCRYDFDYGFEYLI